MRSWRKIQLRNARQRIHLRHSRIPKLRKPCVSKLQFRLALKNTGGIFRRIAKNLHIDQMAIPRLLSRPDWDDMLALFLQEKDSVTDDAENTIRYAINQRLDIGTASLNARWFLSKKKQKEYGEKTTTVIEGGDKPVQTQQVGTVDPLKLLTLDEKRDLLKRIKRQEQKAKELSDGNASED